MLKDIFDKCDWSEHGDYLVLSNKNGRAVGLLRMFEEQQPTDTQQQAAPKEPIGATSAPYERVIRWI